jgi:hypothetical protein
VNDDAGDEVVVLIACRQRKACAVSFDADTMIPVKDDSAFRKIVREFLSTAKEELIGEINLTKIVAYENGVPVTKAELVRRREG